MRFFNDKKSIENMVKKDRYSYKEISPGILMIEIPLDNGTFFVSYLSLNPDKSYNLSINLGDSITSCWGRYIDVLIDYISNIKFKSKLLKLLPVFSSLYNKNMLIKVKINQNKFWVLSINFNSIKNQAISKQELKPKLINILDVGFNLIDELNENWKEVNKKLGIEEYSILYNEKFIPEGEHLIIKYDNYTHHGVKVDDGNIIHFYSPDYNGQGLIELPESKKTSVVTKTDFDTFNKHNKRVGVLRYNRPSFDHSERVLRAYSVLNIKDYDLLKNNCEHIANYICMGEKVSYQVERAKETVKTVSSVLFSSIYFAQNSPDMLNYIENKFNMQIDFATKKMQNDANSFSESVQEVSKIITDNIQNTSNTVKNVNNKISEELQKMSDSVSEKVNKTTDNVKKLVDGFNKQVEMAKKTVDTAEFVMNDFKDFISKIFENTKNQK